MAAWSADAVFASVRASGAAIVQPLGDTDHGSHEFACRDPEGILCSAGTCWPQVPG